MTMVFYVQNKTYNTLVTNLVFDSKLKLYVKDVKVGNVPYENHQQVFKYLMKLIPDLT